jgi:hypothetical protein
LKIGLVAASNTTGAVGIPVSQQQVVVNGQQQPSAEKLTSPGGTGAEAGTLTSTPTAGTGGLLDISPGTTTTASNKFVLTPEYIQHSEYRSVVNERVEGSTRTCMSFLEFGRHVNQEVEPFMCRLQSGVALREQRLQRISALLGHVADVRFEVLEAEPTRIAVFGAKHSAVW